jgi:hypothetical protein
MAKKEREPAPLLCRERQPPCRGQVGGFAVFRHLAHNRVYAARLQRFFHGVERVLRRSRADEEQTRRIEAVERTACAMEDARFECREILLHPNDHAAGKCAKPEPESCRGAQIARQSRRQLMGLAPPKPAAEERIDRT